MHRAKVNDSEGKQVESMETNIYKNKPKDTVEIVVN